MDGRHVSTKALNVQTLGERGDLSATPGSQPWAIAMRLSVQAALHNAESSAGHLAQMVSLLREHQGYRQLFDQQGQPFTLYETFCYEPTPWGLGYDPRGIERIIEERKTAQARA